MAFYWLPPAPPLQKKLSAKTKLHHGWLSHRKSTSKCTGVLLWRLAYKSSQPQHLFIVVLIGITSFFLTMMRYTAQAFMKWSFLLTWWGDMIVAHQDFQSQKVGHPSKGKGAPDLWPQHLGFIQALLMKMLETSIRYIAMLPMGSS